MSKADDALPPPFKVGDRVMYVGGNPWQKRNGPPVHRGDIGVVVRTSPGTPGQNASYPVHRRSILGFHASPDARTAVGGWAASREYERVDCVAAPE